MRFEGTIPEEIGLLTKLKILNLHATKLSGKNFITLFAGLFITLPVKFHFDMSFCVVAAGEIPDSVENLNELTDVHIEDTAISGFY